MREVQIQKSFFKVADFLSWKKNNQLDLRPNFQRRSVWKSGAKSYLIDTIFKGFPIPILFIRDKIDPDTLNTLREVVDGQQRLRTILAYIDSTLFNDFDNERDVSRISKSHNKEIGGKTFKELEIEDKKRILNYEFSVHVLSSSFDDREVIQIFRRMNSTTYKLNKQELRNADYFGLFKDSSYNLAEEQLNRWLTWKLFNSDDIARMTEVEATSEIIGYIIDKSIRGKSSTNIDALYKQYDEKFPNQELVETNFQNLMSFLDYIRVQKPESKSLFKKTIFYAFACACQYLLDNRKVILKNESFEIKDNIRSNLFERIENISNRKVSKEIGEALQRRTTNIKERKLIFNYLTDYAKASN